jgi:hypothetical protein
MINGIDNARRWQNANQFVENIEDIVEAGLNSMKLNQLNYGLVVQ